MFNSEQKQPDLFTSSTMDPRISFSNDFADPHVGIKYNTNYREAPVSSDFEFSVKNYDMIHADEIFFKGMLLPLKGTDHGRKLTLRDTLLADDDDDGSFPSLRKGSGWWKERLGLKRTNVVSRKRDRNEHVLEKLVEEKGAVPMFLHDEHLISK
ncbi:DNA repair and recombination protein RAD54-like isoform 1 [Hibiscus syriacus]|uniref:DNA repair and recombination protein RAD54-like isoform 1 n=1 Tax=Hibiscus syriacus TaxID=106335 RepID=A0A6A3BYN9_HIBSY|nr:DNA repair and recombination protein RAD54-like isoform 1 [Hibiscus syriacus]